MRQLFYNSYILSTMDFCSVIWSHSSKYNISKVSILQKRCAKIILRKPIRTPSAILFKQLGWLSFDNRCKFLTAIFVYKYLQGNTPTYIQNILQFANNTSYQLRSNTNNDLTHAWTNSKYGTNSFSYSAMNTWNSIPPFIRNSSSLASFKHKYKACLLSNQC